MHTKPGLGVHGQTGLYRSHRSHSWNRPKLEYITRPINATLEQSFPAQNSIRKVDCCVLLLQSAVLVGLRQNPIFQADAVKIPGKQSPYNATRLTVIDSIFDCKSMAQPIPQAWSHLVALNVEFNVLICVNIKCRYALQPSAVCRHLRDRHKTPRALQKQVEQYIKAFPFTYDHTSVQLPINGSAPQPIIPIVDGFVC